MDQFVLFDYYNVYFLSNLNNISFTILSFLNTRSSPPSITNNIKMITAPQHPERFSIIYQFLPRLLVSFIHDIIRDIETPHYFMWNIIQSWNFSLFIFDLHLIPDYFGKISKHSLHETLTIWWRYDNIHNNGVKTLQMFWQRRSSVKYLSSVVHNDSCLPVGQNLTS